MPKYSDRVDIYDDRGKIVERNVPIEALSPLMNPAIKKIMNLIERSAVVRLDALQKALETGEVGGEHCSIPGREIKLPILENVDALVDLLEKYIRVKPGDDTEITKIQAGKQLLVKIPTLRIESGVEYTGAFTATAAALCQALVDVFKLNIWDADIVHAAVWGRYPQSVNPMGAYVSTLLSVPQMNEGMGYALRNIPCAHIALITRKNALNAAALSSILEQTAMFEMGDAIGSFERFHLLGLAYQGLNADNLVYDLVRENGKTGTVGTVVGSTVKRAIEDNLVRPLEKREEYVVYTTDDMPKWNSYTCAGMLAATMISSGSARAMQHAPSVMLYFTDLIEHETGLPGPDFGRIGMTSIEMSFFSHSIYGGGNPAVFHGNHIVTRHSKGFAIPCIAAAVALDAGTVYYTPEKISGMVGEILSEIPELREPLKYVAEATAMIKGKI
ncbi:MAG: coenzyme-B sulfoethylthiotransferase subunit beta [archaeon]|nr:coenzyme-B sulfoethylthiotransferase subunit beta [archaeon]MCP8315132.1 coenzyme-B sulfoethylthiotransferase subunit beta [archaeon]MCP8316176.1 coenzyme-B sulfoethylthiotransferase subunit beta [archaeon]MCP8319757.1 coenzyme-B sulfoethylthiotransferase subunit beta [archaeon]